MHMLILISFLPAASELSIERRETVPLSICSKVPTLSFLSVLYNLDHARNLRKMETYNLDSQEAGRVLKNYTTRQMLFSAAAFSRD